MFVTPNGICCTCTGPIKGLAPFALWSVTPT
jgi:hypothetical protein